MRFTIRTHKDHLPSRSYRGSTHEIMETSVLPLSPLGALRWAEQNQNYKKTQWNVQTKNNQKQNYNTSPGWGRIINFELNFWMIKVLYFRVHNCHVSHRRLLWTRRIWYLVNLEHDWVIFAVNIVVSTGAPGKVSNSRILLGYVLLLEDFRLRFESVFLKYKMEYRAERWLRAGSSTSWALTGVRCSDWQNSPDKPHI